MKTGTGLSEFLGEFRAAVFLPAMMAVPLLVLAAPSAAQAACIYDDQAKTITCEAGAMGSSILLGTSGDGYSIVVNLSARVSGGGKNAISVGSDTDIDIHGLVDNNARDEPGEYGERANTIEGNSLNTITIRSSGEVLAEGTNTEAAAIKMMGYDNEINNSGTINSDRGVAVWFRNIGVDGTEERNRLTNMGTISTSSSAGVAIRSDDGLGLVLENFGKIIGAVKLGNGNDTLIFRDKSTLTGDVAAGGGDNSIFFYSGSTLTGNITTGDGDDTFTFNHDIRDEDDKVHDIKFSGTINAGKGQNSLTLINSGKKGEGEKEDVLEVDTLAGDLTGITNITKQGMGRWNLTGDLLLYTKGDYVDPGLRKVAVEQGILHLAGNISKFYGQVEINPNYGTAASDPKATLEASAQNLPGWDPKVEPTKDPKIINHGILRFVQDDEGAYSNLISGSGKVEKAGAGPDRPER